MTVYLNLGPNSYLEIYALKGACISQAFLAAQHLDTGSDVYSLSVTLHILVLVAALLRIFSVLLLRIPPRMSCSTQGGSLTGVSLLATFVYFHFMVAHTVLCSVNGGR